MPRFVVQATISVVFVVAGFVILLTDDSPDIQKLAAGWLGTVLGFWLS
jgi:hypothetical protein